MRLGAMLAGCGRGASAEGAPTSARSIRIGFIPLTDCASVVMSDRIVVMGNGPAATIREVLAVPLERPRDKRRTMHDRSYLSIKERLLELLGQGLAKPVAPSGAAAVA